MTRDTHDPVQLWMDEASSTMGGDASQRREAILELESTIHERIDERTAAGETQEKAAHAVLDTLGDPRTMGHALMPQRPLLRPELTRSFILGTWALFAVHFVLVIGATLAGRELALPPLRIQPIALHSVIDMFARTFEVLLFDAGLMLSMFVLRDRLGRFTRIPRASHKPVSEPRHHFASAAFLFLVLIVANFLRDNLIALYLKDGDGMLQIPLIGSGFTDNLMIFNGWIVLAMARECYYGWRGENRGVLALDVVTRAAGIFCLLRIVATRELVDITAAQGMLGPNADTVAALLNTAFSLIALITAAVIAVELVRRVFRLRG